MNFWFVLSFLFSFIPLSGYGEKDAIRPIKLYCFYTTQFKQIYERYFLPSIQDDFELHVSEFPQECPTSVYKSAGWEKTMLRKLQLILEAIQENWGRAFIYSDVDIIFLKPALESILSHLGECDCVIQQGWPRNKLCAGFFAMRGNEKTLQWISNAIYLLQEQICSDDQIAMQKALDEFSLFSPDDISWGYLPSLQFPNGARVLKWEKGKQKKIYSKDSEISFDSSAVLFHASGCIGLDNKIHFLERVRSLFHEDNQGEL